MKINITIKPKNRISKIKSGFNHYRYMSKKVIVSFLLFLAAGPIYGQQSNYMENPPPTIDELLKWHEVFTYEVQYSFFKLGEVKVEIVSDSLLNGEKSRYLKTIITSSGIPFAGDEKNRYSSIFMASGNSFKALTFWTDNMDENEPNTSRYIFDYKRGKVYGYIKEKSRRDTLKLVRPASAGHLLFYMSRLRAGTDTTVAVPVYINLKKKQAVITHTTTTDIREYDAFDHPVKTFYSYGNANFDGPFGFSGAFEAWYLAGELRIPVEAKVDVWIGNVQIKLIDYKKELR